MENIISQLSYCIEKGKVNISSNHPSDLIGKPGVTELTREALNLKIPPEVILNDGLLSGMKAVGEKFRDGIIFLPEVLISAKAMNSAMEILRPYFISGEIRLKGKLILGTVEGDLHDIGKNIVKMVLEGAGWEVIDLGINVSADKFIDAINQHKVKVVGMSALLSTTMLNMSNIVQKIKAEFSDMIIVLGGAPLTKGFAESVKANHYFPDPQSFLDYLDNNLI
ncbi:MAG: cobalamin-dependent protein [Ignavibacterium sp.]|jgi:5-methyltetrahydrofolate--homocysteine methyltransferase|nr:cobalamin-dependent protein [Ignavibacterium sp.]